MAVTPIENVGGTSATPEDKFNMALNKAQEEISEEEFTEALISNAVSIGGLFIIMPKLQEILGEALSAGDEE
ncbi:hypothetical protein ACYU03_19345 [Pseudomonas sp. X10]